jgi:hypothetical protein
MADKQNWRARHITAVLETQKRKIQTMLVEVASVGEAVGEAGVAEVVEVLGVVTSRDLQTIKTLQMRKGRKKPTSPSGRITTVVISGRERWPEAGSQVEQNIPVIRVLWYSILHSS